MISRVPLYRQKEHPNIHNVFKKTFVQYCMFQKTQIKKKINKKHLRPVTSSFDPPKKTFNNNYVLYHEKHAFIAMKFENLNFSKQKIIDPLFKP